MSMARSVLLSLFFALLLSAGGRVSATSGNTISFSAPVVATDPCTGEVGTGTLDVLIVVNEVVTGAGVAHVTAHARVHGQLTGSRGSVYQVSAEGTSESASVADLYDVPFHGTAAGEGTAPNLTVDGVADVHVATTGAPTGLGVVSLSAGCGW